MDRVTKAYNKFQKVNTMVETLCLVLEIPENSDLPEIFKELGVCYKNYHIAMQEWGELQGYIKPKI